MRRVKFENKLFEKYVSKKLKKHEKTHNQPPAGGQSHTTQHSEVTRTIENGSSQIVVL